MIRKSKPKEKNIELLKKFLKVYKSEVEINTHIKGKNKQQS
mgnify:FL=1|tara:strand:- start:225 stop:347 length:123 start_codon:yes stop_codon:yes gene_type:complete